MGLSPGQWIYTGICWEYFKIFLRYSWENLGNSSQEIPRNWFWRMFLWKFPRISANFVDIFSGFSVELVTRNFLELVTRKSLYRVRRNSSEWVTRNSSQLAMVIFLEWVTKNYSILLSTFSPDFPVKDSLFVVTWVMSEWFVWN